MRKQEESKQEGYATNIIQGLADMVHINYYMK